MKMLDHPNLVAITAAWPLSLSTRGRCAFHVRASIIQLRFSAPLAAEEIFEDSNAVYIAAWLNVAWFYMHG